MKASAAAIINAMPTVVVLAEVGRSRGVGVVPIGMETRGGGEVISNHHDGNCTNHCLNRNKRFGIWRDLISTTGQTLFFSEPRPQKSDNKNSPHRNQKQLAALAMAPVELRTDLSR